ncbi:CXXC motif containing zinc binding protein-like isoform X1 [Apostichopus japonicus]
MKVGLQMKANLENVTNLKADGMDFRWYMKFQCSNCQEVSTAFQYITLAETTDLKGGRGSANLVSKCKLCSRENSVAIIPESLTSYNADDSNRFKTIVSFECRGMTPVEYSPRVGFVCQGAESSSKFEVDLGENEWVDYDEQSKESVGIYEFESKFVNLK